MIVVNETCNSISAMIIIIRRADNMNDDAWLKIHNTET